MHFRLSALIAASLILASSFACSHAQINGAQGPYALRVSNSDKEIETALGKYLEEKKDWKVQYLIANNNPEDIYLGLVFKMGKGVPDLKVRIDTFTSNEQKGLVQARRILVETYRKVGIKPGDAHYLDMLNWINKHSEKYWVPDQMYLDKDGDLAMKSSQNVVGRDYNLHAEQVSDMIIRLAMSWEDINKNLPDYARAAPNKAPQNQAQAAETQKAADDTSSQAGESTQAVPDAQKPQSE